MSYRLVAIEVNISIRLPVVVDVSTDLDKLRCEVWALLDTIYSKVCD